jgi:hypothetical protein
MEENNMLPLLPTSLHFLTCTLNYSVIEEFWRFKETYYKLKYGHRLERYFLNVIKKRKQQINNELLYSPQLKFYKQFADPITLETMKN